jgi:lysozyme family protein
MRVPCTVKPARPEQMRVRLKPEDVKPAYRHYFDQAFAKIGGAKVLDDIGDPKVASAIADTLFRSGPGKGAEMVQDAANAAGAGISPDSAFGSRTLDAIKEIAGSAERTQVFLDELTKKERTAALQAKLPVSIFSAGNDWRYLLPFQRKSGAPRSTICQPIPVRRIV